VTLQELLDHCTKLGRHPAELQLLTPDFLQLRPGEVGADFIVLTDQDEKDRT